MTDNEEFRLEKFPKNGRIDKYCKDFSMILDQKDVSCLELFMRKVFDDCTNYLKKVSRLDFPNMLLTIIYTEEEYAGLCQKLNEAFGPKPCTKAIAVVSGSEAFIYMDFRNHFKGKSEDFIINLSISYIEELVHSVYPNKSETEIHELVCSAIDGFLEIKLADEVRQERLKRARIFNGH